MIIKASKSTELNLDTKKFSTVTIIIDYAYVTFLKGFRILDIISV